MVENESGARRRENENGTPEPHAVALGHRAIVGEGARPLLRFSA